MTKNIQQSLPLSVILASCLKHRDLTCIHVKCLEHLEAPDIDLTNPNC